MENFVFHWLLEYIGHKIDFRQYGGIKGNSICHYLIELINFILMHQDNKRPTAVLTCMVDFAKAFNRQDHNILITKLSDMGVPSWLLKIVISFLSDRKMYMRYKGKTSSARNLPGGGPQRTLFGLLINNAGFDNQVNNIGELITCNKKMNLVNEIHLKYIDDLTIGEAIDLRELRLVSDEDRTLPDNYHARTGHDFPLESSKVVKQLVNIKEYANDNKMKINIKKTKVILFNPSKKIDFDPQIRLEGDTLINVEEIKLLGLTLRSDMKWTSNTDSMTSKAYKRLWALRRLKSHGADQNDLVEVYSKQIRPTLEFAVPVWHPGISKGEKNDIERVQKSAAKIILQEKYQTYIQALQILNLEQLSKRRMKICNKFATKAENHAKFSSWFKLNKRKTITRSKQPRYCPVLYRTRRFQKSPLCYLTDLLNTKHLKS